MLKTQALADDRDTPTVVSTKGAVGTSYSAVARRAKRKLLMEDRKEE